MRVCISATGKNLDAVLDPRFGRAVYFLIVDNQGRLIKAIKNTGVQAMQGAGITAAQIVAQEKVNVVISGNVGPKALMVLGSSGIKIFLCRPGMKVKDVFRKYQKGELEQATEASASRPGVGPGFGQRRRGSGGRGRGRR